MSTEMQFPLLNRLAHKTAPILRSRLWLGGLLLLLFIFYLPWIFSGYRLDDYRQLSGFIPAGVEKAGIPVETFYKGPSELYSFSTGDSTDLRILKQKGIYPWWGSEGMLLNFWRPLTSLSLALDYSLWPGWLNSFYVDRFNPYQPGDVIELEPMTIEIVNTLQDGTIKEALFRFHYSLAPPECLVLSWDFVHQQYSEVSLPEIGRTVVYQSIIPAIKADFTNQASR